MIRTIRSGIREGRLGRRLVWTTTGLSILFLVIVCLGYVLIWLNFSHSIGRVQNLFELRQNVNRMEVALIDQETGQRGYILTDDPEFLQPFQQGSADYTRESNDILSEVKNYPEMQENIKNLIVTGQQWHTHFGVAQINQRTANQVVSNADLLAAKDAFDHFRSVSSQTQQQLSAALMRERANMMSSLVRVLITLASFSLVAGLVILAVLRRQFRFIVRPLVHLSSAAMRYTEQDFDATLPDVSGPANEMTTLISDIDTMRTQLKESFDLNDAVLNMIPQLLRAGGISDVYYTVIRQLAVYFECEFASIIAFDMDQARVVCKYEGNQFEQVNLPVETDDMEALSNLLNGKSSVFSDWNVHRPNGVREQQYYDAGVRSSVHLPILYQNHVVAAINLASTRPHQVSNHTLDTLSHMVPLITMAMIFISSEERNRKMIELSPIMMAVHSEGVFRYMNPAGVAMLGAHSPQDVVGMSVMEIIHPDYVSEVRNRVGRLYAMDTTLHDTEIRFVTLDGREIDVEVRAQSLEYMGQPSALVIGQDITGRKLHERQLTAANARLRELSNMDGLTGLANRRYLDEHIAEEWKRTQRASSYLSVILMDIDYFKAYNDTYGHLSGDTCLRLVAEAVRNALKRPSDFAARYGGEEFVIVLPDTDVAGATTVAEAIRTAVHALQIPHSKSQVSRFVSISAGVASLIPSSTYTSRDLIDMADKALYAVKQAGRNRVEPFATNG